MSFLEFDMSYYTPSPTIKGPIPRGGGRADMSPSGCRRKQGRRSSQTGFGKGQPEGGGCGPGEPSMWN